MTTPDDESPAKRDTYRPSDYDSPTGPYSRWAFTIVPQAQRSGESWTAWYPGSDWSVTAGSKEEALQKLRSEMDERLREGERYGEYMSTYTEAAHRMHLEKPIPGIYAMDIGLYNELRETEPDADLETVFREAEAKRVAGETYTMSDYRRNHAKDKS